MTRHAAFSEKHALAFDAERAPRRDLIRSDHSPYKDPSGRTVTSTASADTINGRAFAAQALARPGWWGWGFGGGSSDGVVDERELRATVCAETQITIELEMRMPESSPSPALVKGVPEGW